MISAQARTRRRFDVGARLFEPPLTQSLELCARPLQSPDIEPIAVEEPAEPTQPCTRSLPDGSNDFERIPQDSIHSGQSRHDGAALKQLETYTAPSAVHSLPISLYTIKLRLQFALPPRKHPCQNLPALSELRTQLRDIQPSPASHVDKESALEGMFAWHEAVKREVSFPGDR
ncbi:hypothetical protein HWV62_26885 [Athelia sp. TMB]|nr:hypothetical protein HWV62_26885 [Athelia sp. TMB]